MVGFLFLRFRVRFGGDHTCDDLQESFFIPIYIRIRKNLVRDKTFSLLRKEVIHPLLPERIPCYDLPLITELAFDSNYSGLWALPTFLS